MVRRISIGAAVVGAAAVALWVLWPSPEMPDAAHSPDNPASNSVAPSNIRVPGAPIAPRPRAGLPQAVAPSPGPRHPLADLFPTKAHHVCPAPEAIAQGRYNAGEADVLVRNGETVVWSGNNPGGGTARWLGRWLGDISWENGHCEWVDTPEIAVTFEVSEVGVHTIAGCPIGEAVQTDEDGVVTVMVPSGQHCTARVVGGPDGLMMSTKVTVTATENTTVEMDADKLPLTDEEIDQGLSILTRMMAYQVDQAQMELDRLTAVGTDGDEVAWLIEAAEERVSFMEGELAKLEDEDTQLRALADFLYSQSN